MNHDNEQLADKSKAALPPAEPLKRRWEMKGDFASGMRTMPVAPEGPDYARGARTRPMSSEGPDYARGARTQPMSSEGPDYARGMRA